MYGVGRSGNFGEYAPKLFPLQMELRALFKFKCHDFLVTERFAGAPVVLGPPAPVFPEF